MSSRTLAVAAGVVALVGAGAASAAPRAFVSGPGFTSGLDVLVVGIQFAPPNEFCTSVSLRVNGRVVRPRTRQSDDLGTWTLRFRADLPKGSHRIELRQTCESGADGSKRTQAARTRLLIR